MKIAFNISGNEIKLSKTHLKKLFGDIKDIKDVDFDMCIINIKHLFFKYTSDILYVPCVFKIYL